MTKWQPIETAPKDGDLFLGFLAVDDECSVMMWHDGWEDWTNAEGQITGYPTHWMPLPEPPEVD